MDTGRLLRWVAIGGGIVVVLLAAVAAIVVATVDAGALVRYATAETSKATGRRIEVAGPVELAWWPRLALVASGVSIGNPPGASREHFAKAARIRGSVATWPLIARRAVELDRLEIEGLDLRLETLADGSGNWQFASPGGAAAASASRADGAGASVRLAGPVVVGGADIVWAPHGEATPESIRIERFEIAPRDGARLGWSGRLEHQKTSWTLEAVSGDPFASLRERVPFDFDARLDGGGVAVKAKGRVERRDSGPGAVADVALEWTAGSERVASLAPAFAREAGKVGGRLEVAGRRITVAGLAGSVAGARFDGNLSLDAAAPVERVRGRLHVERVDLAKLRASGGAPKPTPATASARAATPATHALKQVDADVDFVVDRIVAGGVEIANTRGRVVVADGKLAADPVVAELGGGTLTLRVQADAASDRARVVLDGRNIEIGRVAGALPAGRTASGGRATLAIDLQGPASDAFVARSSGSIRADVGPMRIEGPPSAAGAEALSRLADAINPLRRTEKSTELQCVVARLAVRDGVAHADRTLAAETSMLAVSASGTIDLGHQTLDLLIRPRARKGLSIGAIELAELVRVTGPIANPSVGLDKVGAAKAAIAVGGAVASGGWSLLASPLLNAGEDPSPCATARAGGKSTGEPAAGASPRPAEDLAGALRGLFKR